MKINITFSLDLDNGEAELTSRSKQILQQMIDRAELLDYDLMMDMYHVMEYAFDALKDNYYHGKTPWQQYISEIMVRND